MLRDYETQAQWKPVFHTSSPTHSDIPLLPPPLPVIRMTSRATESTPSHTKSGCLTSFRNLLGFRKPTAVEHLEVPLENTNDGITLAMSTTATRIASEADINRRQTAMGLQNQMVTVYAHSETHWRHCQSRFKPTDNEWINACSDFEEVRNLREREKIFDYT
jgi:ribosomal protein L32E